MIPEADIPGYGMSAFCVDGYCENDRFKTVMNAKNKERFLCIVRNLPALVDIIHKLWYINSVSC